MRAAIVTVHDVTPWFENRILQIDTMLRSEKISYARGVVPFYHNRQECDLASSSRFVDYLKSEPTEIVLHGYAHAGWFMEDEFGFASHTKATELLRLGKEKLDSLGLKTYGFIPPMWRLSSPAVSALRELGFEFTETIRRLLDLRKQSSYESFVCGYHVGNRTLNQSLLLLNWVNFHTKLRRHTLVRLAIHPQDSDSALRQAMSFILQLKRDGYVFHNYRTFFRSIE